MCLISQKRGEDGIKQHLSSDTQSTAQKDNYPSHWWALCFQNDRLFFLFVSKRERELQTRDDTDVYLSEGNSWDSYIASPLSFRSRLLNMPPLSNPSGIPCRTRTLGNRAGLPSWAWSKTQAFPEWTKGCESNSWPFCSCLAQKILTRWRICLSSRSFFCHWRNSCISGSQRTWKIPAKLLVPFLHTSKH